MGMYDYLGGEQIKIFYTPIFDKGNSVFGNSPSTWHSGGNLRSFEIGDDLPLKTLYYKYPNNFIVYDYSCGDKYPVWIIKNGTLKETKSIHNITEDDFGDSVVDYYGYQLNIRNTNDFTSIYNDLIKLDDNKSETEKKYFKNGSFTAIKEEPEYFDSVKDKYYEELEVLNKQFADNWFIKDKCALEKQFGEYLDCYLMFDERKDREVSEWDNPMEDYLACKKTIKEFIKNNENIVDKYFEWLDHEDRDLNNIISNIKIEFQ